jgi:hypothetical protein
MNDEESRFLAGKIADCILRDWGFELCQGFAAQTRDGKLAIRTLPITGLAFKNEIDPKLEHLQRAVAFLSSQERYKLADVIAGRDRGALIDYFQELIVPWPRESAELLLSFLKSFPERIRKGAVEISKFARRRSGRKSKINPAHYENLAARGTQLAPLILRLLQELGTATKRSVQELLVFWGSDYPGESQFLLKYIDRFKAALKDQRLCRRAVKLRTRALAIADAMAGAEFDLELSTSYERAREGRRNLKSAIKNRS